MSWEPNNIYSAYDSNCWIFLSITDWIVGFTYFIVRTCWTLPQLLVKFICWHITGENMCVVYLKKESSHPRKAWTLETILQCKNRFVIFLNIHPPIELLWPQHLENNLGIMNGEYTNTSPNISLPHWVLIANSKKPKLHLPLAARHSHARVIIQFFNFVYLWLFVDFQMFHFWKMLTNIPNFRKEIDFSWLHCFTTLARC